MIDPEHTTAMVRGYQHPYRPSSLSPAGRGADPWMVYEQEWVDELSSWPRPLLYRIFDFWMKVDSSVVELLKGKQ